MLLIDRIIQFLVRIYYIMDYSAYNLKPYQSLPLLNKDKIHELIQQKKKLLFFHQLVVDVTNFDHPGNNNLLQRFQNQPNKSFNLLLQFEEFKHSYNAQLLICLRTIGVYQRDSSYQEALKVKGKHLYQRIRQNQKIKLHEAALKKIDFNKPILKQLQNLSVAQKQIMVEIPKLLDNPQKVLFKQTPLEQYLFTNSFWVSTISFQIILMIFAWHIFSNYDFYDILKNSPFFIIGIIKWTMLEYYFHRFLLHYDMSKKNKIEDHLLHHIFPNKKNKLAITVHKILLYFIGFYFIYSLLFSHLQIMLLLSGLLISITIYDIVHYWCHFGYQTNIKWINYLRRNHLKHHYRDPNKGFGVTNTFWDYVFGTLHVSA